jgi:hypothetical protein
MTKTIELDCEPMAPRPDTYIASVLEGTGIPVKVNCSACFGNWTWDYSEIPDDVWEAAKPVLKERITALYNNGRIRYGSW